MKRLIGMMIITVVVVQCAPKTEEYRDRREVHLKNIKRLTFGGQNAEAYFSPDGKYITFQSNRDSLPCDQIFIMDTTGKILRMVSTGEGRTTCSFFLDNDHIMFASTHETMGPECPENPLVYQIMKKEKRYVWPLYNYDLYIRDLRTNELKKLFGSPAYEAELEGPSPDGKIVFTSAKDGDLELYILDPPYTGEPRRLTFTPGYDGGSFFSKSGRYIVYRADHIKDSTELKKYREYLQKGLLLAGHLEIYVYDLQTDSTWQVTHTPKEVTNFAPFMTPDEKRIIFVSNLDAPGTWEFQLYIIDIDGKNLERVTYMGTFNSFPMFSPDGKKLLFVSNRGTKKPRNYDVYIADWQ